MFIPGFLISLATFPGVIVHELAHVAFCKFTDTRVLKVCLFRVGNPAGYVIHEQPSTVWRHILIGVGPFFINTVLGLMIGIVAIPMHMDLDHPTPVQILLLWLGVSIAMHSFPSTGDARSIWHAVWSKGAPISAKLLGAPLVVVIFVGAIGSIVWLDVLYGVGVVGAAGALQKASLRKYQANAAKIVPADYHPNFADLVPVATPPTALQSPNKWFEFLSPDNDFKLSAPGQLVNAEPTRDVVPNVIFKLKESENPYGVYFHVKRLDFPHGTLAGLPSTILDSALNAARDKDVSAIQGQLVGDSPVSLESYPGREIRFSAEAGSILATERMYIVGDHLYLILAIRKPSEEADSAVTRFLNSFRLITQPR